ncbi:hypothetical protein MBLNU457_6418t1 [Dothideomycetes sp. NU457]
MSDTDISRYPLEDEDLETISEDDIIQSCKLPFTHKNNEHLYRISSEAIVKVDHNEMRESSNMTYIAQHTNGKIRLPKIYRSFVRGKDCYTVMQFVDGETLDAVPWQSRGLTQRTSIVKQVVAGIAVLRTLTSDIPGPVGGGTSVGNLFGAFGARRAFSNARELETWMDQKLVLGEGGILAGKFDILVMCHMDIALRNLMLDSDGNLWFLDWEWAGFYPAEFEIASLHPPYATQDDEQFCAELLWELNAINKSEVVDLVLDVFKVNRGENMLSHVLGNLKVEIANGDADKDEVEEANEDGEDGDGGEQVETEVKPGADRG